MKVRFPTLLILSLVLLLSVTACSSAPADEQEETDGETVAAQSESESEAESDKTQEEGQGEEKTVPLYTNPLTGESTETDISNLRPYAIMLNTLKKALPQSGNSLADIYFEIPEEGGVTRIMGLYQSIEGVGTIGTIRSTRDYYAYLVAGLDAFLVHAGGSSTGLSAVKEYNIASLDFLNGFSKYYWRDEYRKVNVGMEHSLYTSSDNLLAATAASGLRTEHEEGYTLGLTFSEETVSGDSAVTVSVPFSGYKTTVFDYDAAVGTYAVSMFDSPYIDAVTDEQIYVTNVVVIQTSIKTLENSRLRIDLTSGSGYLANGGSYVSILWAKGNPEDPLTITDTDGNPIELSVGKSYICICSTSAKVSFE